MKYLLAILLLYVFNSINAQTYTPICHVFGQIYIEPDPKLAQYKVFIEQSEYAADIVIFKENNQLFADTEGKWFMTDNIYFANYTVCFVSDKKQAQFSVYFTDIDSYARCNRK
jgi:hypothetical protein